MEDNKYQIQRIYYLLEGLKQSVDNSVGKYVDKETVRIYNGQLEKLSEIIEDDLSDYLIKIEGDYGAVDYLLYKLTTVINYLKHMYIDSSEYQIQKVGALYKSIEDKELKRRCEDLLLGEDAFDRAINQATQVFEDRIKQKAGIEKTHLIGLPLVSKSIHKDLNETILKFSDEPDVQEGYSNLFKGIISIYRNPTHHSIDYVCNREYALKTCAFIDDLLKEVDKSSKVK